MAKWIRFNLVEQGAKTNVWEVTTLVGQVLGRIRWAGAFRKYAFFPNTMTLYEPTCLRDLAEFIEEQMAARKKGA